MAFTDGIGYNVKQANELMNRINEAYKNLGIYTKEQWNGVVDALQQNWVGEDEQHYEDQLAQKLCVLYVNAQQLVSSALNTIGGLAQAWIDFQSKNTIDGSQASYSVNGKVEIPTIKPDDEIVKFKKRTIGANDDRGLTSASSKTNIQSAVDTFVGQIKSKTEGLFSDIDASNAFFGEQTATIKTYVEKVGAAIGEVTIAVKDMYEALDKLVASNYTTATSDISQQFTQAQSDVDNSLNDLGSSRWV